MWSVTVSRYKSGVTLQNQAHSHIGLIDKQWTRRLEAIRGKNGFLFYFSGLSFGDAHERASIYNERARRVNQSILNTTRTGNLFNKIIRTANEFNKITICILPSKGKREILFEATRTYVWLKLDVCNMCARFAQPRLKWLFCQSERRFHHFLAYHWGHDRFLVYPITDCFLVFKSRF